MENLSPARTLMTPQQGLSFPGGNDGIQRCIVKWLNPEAIEGAAQFPEDPQRPDPVRHAGPAGHAVPDAGGRDGGAGGAGSGREGRVGAGGGHLREGRHALHGARPRPSSGSAASWTAKHAMQDLPEDYRTAMESFPRSPMLSVNVALDNWRFLYDLGYTACSWRGGFGFTANIRPNMYVGDYRPPLDPDQPNLFTFYVPFNQHGLSLVDQGKVGRHEALGDELPGV